VPHRQQSAIISQKRTDIGARQSGQAQRIALPSSQISPGARGDDDEGDSRLTSSNSMFSPQLAFAMAVLHHLRPRRLRQRSGLTASGIRRTAGVIGCVDFRLRLA